MLRSALVAHAVVGVVALAVVLSVLSGSSNEDRELALATTGVLWALAALVIVLVWRFGTRRATLLFGPSAAWAIGSLVIGFSLVSPAAEGFAPVREPESAQVERGSVTAPQPAPTTSPQAPPTTPEPTSARLCKKEGIRYVGTTSVGAAVCFTLTPDRAEWVEIGVKFIRASRCDASATGDIYYEGPTPLDGPGRITLPGFNATIRGVTATGVLEDPEICNGKTFAWSARRVG
jgi:hypothetical protein